MGGGSECEPKRMSEKQKDKERDSDTETGGKTRVVRKVGEKQRKK